MDFEFDRIEVRQETPIAWRAYVYGTGTDAYVCSAGGLSAVSAVRNVMDALVQVARDAEAVTV